MGIKHPHSCYQSPWASTTGAADNRRMRTAFFRRPAATGSILLVATLAFLASCSSSHPASTLSPSTSTSTSAPISTSVSIPSGAEALGTNNPAQGDCTTNTSEAATAVGYVTMTVTASSFQAQIQLQKGYPDTTYGVLLQQVPGSCPQQAANGGTFITNPAGSGHASASVARVSGASTFFVQLVPLGSQAPSYTSNRTSGSS